MLLCSSRGWVGSGTNRRKPLNRPIEVSTTGVKKTLVAIILGVLQFKLVSGDNWEGHDWRLIITLRWPPYFVLNIIRKDLRHGVYAYSWRLFHKPLFPPKCECITLKLSIYNQDILTYNVRSILVKSYYYSFAVKCYRIPSQLLFSCFDDK